MKKHNIKFLVLSCAFVTTSLALLIYEVTLVINALQFAYQIKSIDNLVDAIFVDIAVLQVLLTGAFATVFAIGSLPFVITLAHREGKKWFTILLVVAAIALFILPTLTFLSMPIITSLNPISSSSMSSSSAY